MQPSQCRPTEPILSTTVTITGCASHQAIEQSNLVSERIGKEADLTDEYVLRASLSEE
jgi:hypothetical protein